MCPSPAIKKILQEQKLAPSKKLGQNFLINEQTSKRIVQCAGVGEEDTVVELGVGLGSLTQPLAQSVKHIIGLEIDRGIIQFHEEEQDLPDNVELFHQDLLSADYHSLAKRCKGRLKIMANLPYSITNPLLFKLIEHRESLSWAVLMLQKEVGQRLTAAKDSKQYGVLSVLLASCASVETLLHVGPGNFHPRPKVDSVVVKITFDPKPSRVEKLPDFDYELFAKLVNGAFRQRRKTLVNALAAAQVRGLGKPEITAVLNSVSISPKARAENLLAEDYIAIANKLNE